MASSIKEAFQKAAAAVFNAAGNVKESVIYRKKINENATYNPSSNTVKALSKDYYNINMIPSNYSIEEIDGQTVLATDIKMRCLVADLKPRPKVNDIIVRTETNENGQKTAVEWDVKHYSKDSADAVWTFQIRKP